MVDVELKTINPEEVNFLKSLKWQSKNEDGDFIFNSKMESVLSKNLQEINDCEEDVMFLRAWINRLRQLSSSATKNFIWDDSEVLDKKVFPMGEHSNFFYYGLLLPKVIDNVQAGKVFGKKQVLHPCILTSSRVFLEVNERLKETHNLDFENIPSYLPKRWELSDIKQFLEGKSKKVARVELLKKITEQYEKYIFIRNKTWYVIYALWDIGTYLYQIFEAYPFLENRGIAGTGKSKTMFLSSLISFNGGQVMVSPSESTLFRETDEVRGAKYFDEAEKLWIYNKSTGQYEGDGRVELINASYTKDAKVPRQERIGNRFVTRWYSPYSPTQLSSINGLFGATEQRAITRIATKSPNEDSRGETEPAEDKNEPIWAEIRNACYRFALENYREIKKVYLDFPKDCGLKRRDLQIWKPLLSLAKFLSEDLYQEVLDFAVELSERRLDDLIQESSPDFFCLKAFSNVIHKNPTSQKFYINDIKNFYCELRGIDDFKNPYLNRTISNRLDKMGFKEFRKRDKLGSYYGLLLGDFYEIVNPICPNLVFLSSSSSLSSSSHTNTIKIDDDKMTIDDDKVIDKMTKMTIDDENDDTYGVDKTPEKTLLEALKILQQETGTLIPMEKIEQLPFENVHATLNKLKSQGKLFTPRKGFVCLVD